MSILPDPNDYPAASVVIYDGQCQFCSRQVRRLARLDGKNRLSFLSLHDPRIESDFPALSHDELMEAMHLVEPSGTIHRGAAAFRLMTRRLPRLWILVPLMHLPFSLPLWQAIYHYIARRRYRMNCDEGTCQTHLHK
jgi:predicted DCC family thiol-disulfide oxidoreductase YuxK